MIFETAKNILNDIFFMKIGSGYELHRKDGSIIYLKRISEEEWKEIYAPEEKS